MNSNDAMSSKPLVSVVVPVYNIPPIFVEQCLKSLAEQSLKSVQIIVVDDGSTREDSIAICDEMAYRYSSIEVIHKANEGVSVARNVGIEHSRAEWIAFVDADDWAEPRMLEVLYNSVCMQPATDIAVCDCYVEYEDHTVTNSFLPKSFNSNSYEHLERQHVLLQILGRNRYYYPPEIAIGVPWAKLYRKSFIINSGLSFQPGLRRMQDNIFNLYAFHEAKYVLYLSEPLYHYRKFEQSTSNKFSPNVFQDFENMFAATVKFINKYHLNDEIQQGYYARVIQSFNSYSKFYFFHPNNHDTNVERFNQLRALVQREPYKSSLDSIDICRLPIEMKVLAILLKLRWFSVIGAIVKLRQVRRKTQN